MKVDVLSNIRAFILVILPFCILLILGFLIPRCGAPIHQLTPTVDRTQIAELKEAAEKGDPAAQFTFRIIFGVRVLR